jgi:hypothetical protein
VTNKTNSNSKAKNEKKVEPLKEMVKINTKWSPKSVKMNSTDIYVYGVLPRKSGYKYQRYTVHLKNYFNGEWGKLFYEQASVNNYIKGFSPVEGMLYYYNPKSKLNDVDFDMVSGLSGDYSSKYSLNIVSIKVYKV